MKLHLHCLGASLILIFSLLIQACGNNDSPPPQRQIVIEASDQILRVGLISRITALRYTEGHVEDVTNSMIFKSNNPAVATIQGNIITATGAGNTMISGSLEGDSASIEIQVEGVALDKIEVNALDDTMYVGSTQQFKAEGFYADGLILDISDNVLWYSSDRVVADVEQGLVTAITAGLSDIFVESGIEHSNYIRLTVLPGEPVSIVVEPPSGAFYVGRTALFRAVGEWGDGSKAYLGSHVNWFASNDRVTQIQDGYFKGAQGGAVTISAIYLGVEGLLDFVVEAAQLNNIDVEPLEIDSVPLGGSVEVTAYGQFSDSTIKDISEDVLWRQWAVGSPDICDVGGQCGAVEFEIIDNKVFARAVQRGVVKIIADMDGKTSYPKMRELTIY